MPTGYTADLTKEQEMTFKEFLLNCAKAFGACITMRDDPPNTPIPEEFQVRPYHQEQLDKANKELEEFRKLTNEDFEAKAQKCYELDCESFEKAKERNSFTRDRYTTMLNKVMEWKPPTTEHEGLKKFMKEQITSSLDFDIYPPREPSRMSASQYKKSTLSCILNDIKYHTNAYKEEIEHVANKNKWIKDLRDSLK